MSAIQELHSALQQKKISAVELTKHYLQKIAANPTLNAFISVDETHAFKQALQADKRIQQGQAQVLTGIPMAHKDLFCTTTLPTTCASKMLANFQAPYAATIVDKLEQSGAILLGKTNMDEFAMGSTNQSSYFGPVKNPWDLTRAPGGSSGGSAAAVAAGLVAFATGSDTGGSIRQPAAWCGISGLKPTYGLVSRFGMVAFASSLDQAGPMARSAADLALILQHMAGFDIKDATSSLQSIPNYSEHLTAPINGLRIGLPRYVQHQHVDLDIQMAIKEAVRILSKAGARIVDIDFEHQTAWVPCYDVIACAEASSNLARYDGVRYGHQSSRRDSIQELITQSRSEGFGANVKRRLLTGTYLLSAGNFEDYYLQALKVRRLIHHEYQNIFKQVDVILGPTTPNCAFELNETVQHYLADVFTVSANLAGLPALSIPCGFSKGLPIGLQLIGNYFNEKNLLNVAHVFQQQTDWHQREPSGLNPL